MGKGERMTNDNNPEQSAPRGRRDPRRTPGAPAGRAAGPAAYPAARQPACSSRRRRSRWWSRRSRGRAPSRRRWRPRTRRSAWYWCAATIRNAAGPDDFYPMGTVCRIHRVAEHGGQAAGAGRGLQRFRIEDSRWSRERPFVRAREYFPETGYQQVPELKAYSMAIINTIKELLPLNPLYGEETQVLPQPLRARTSRRSWPTSPPASPPPSKQELQDVLETFDPAKRMEKVLVLLKKELEVAQPADARSAKQVEEKISEQQREFFLREQLKAIQKELGLAKDDKTAELETFQRAAREAQRCPRRPASASTRRCRSCRCSRPARRSTRSRATTSTG
ncbi:MAG: LON peptidase substrate-binding domain-containing protein [Chromatiales bacterium]|nr:LON peptidase substrate-binding domain-containing protein [Chromatiales bacterium]